MSKYVSKYGLILPNSRQEQSENGVLFSVEDLFLTDDLKYPIAVDVIELSRRIEYLRVSNGGEYRTIPNDNNPRFSIDNSIAVAAFCRFALRKYKGMIDVKESLRTVPLYKSESMAYLRPDVFCFLALCKWPILNLLILPRLIVSIGMILSSMRPKRETSGKLLAYVKYKGLNMRWTWFICTKLFDPSEAFQVYFPEWEHPCNVKAREIWDEEFHEVNGIGAAYFLVIVLGIISLIGNIWR